jgi:hypothetical protein
MSKKMRLCLFATREQIEKLRKLPAVRELHVEKLSPEAAMRHEAALMEAAEVLREAGMDGAVVVFLDS